MNQHIKMSHEEAEDNDRRFSMLLRAENQCEYMQKQLDDIDRLNTQVNDVCLVRLLDNAIEVDSFLKERFLSPDEFKKLHNNPELDCIESFTTRLEECIDDPQRYHEAAEILERMDNLHKKYGHQVPLLDSMHQKSEGHKEYLISNLCYRLENLKDSDGDEAHSIVNNMIRCGSFSDRDLRLKYLQARDNWFDDECEKKSASFDDVVSVYCKGLPLIFSEYKNIFADSSEVLNRKLLRLSTTDSTKEDGAIINSWLLLKATVFIASLDVYLTSNNPNGKQTPSMLSDTIHKCFELTDWLASIGFDFSSQLKPLFAKALIEEVKSSIENATTKFESAFSAAISNSIESLLLPVDDEILRVSDKKSENQLPSSIEHYPIFRIYCLYIIESLRWFLTTRNVLTPINLCLDTYATLNASLTRVMKALALALHTDNNSNHPILSKIAVSFITEVVPFIMTYCEKIFPEKTLLSAIGLSKSEFKTIYASEPEKLKNFRIDLKQIADPLKRTLPTLIKGIEN